MRNDPGSAEAVAGLVPCVNCWGNWGLMATLGGLGRIRGAPHLSSGRRGIGSVHRGTRNSRLSSGEKWPLTCVFIMAQPHLG